MSHEEAVMTMASERYLLDEMADTERDAFEEHYFTCPDCADEVRVGEQMRVRVSKVHAVEAAHWRPPVPFVPRRAASTWRAPKILLPWAAAAVLLIAVGYQSLVVMPHLRGLNATQALATITLRPASRGEVPVVSLEPGSAFVPLALEINADAGIDRLAYTVQDEQGATLASGETARPASGASLLLLVPARDLTAGGTYVVAVRNPIDGGALIGEYRFNVAPASTTP
jgi:hypothetical protein